VNAGEELGSEPVIPCGDPSEVLEPAEHALDGVAAAVKDLAEAGFPSPRGLGRDVRDGALILDEVADAVRVVGAVGQYDAARTEIAE
jgi:hypothetical protein